jgi:sigma-B regulation protein RsbU (phosphoserine phosphatase)
MSKDMESARRLQVGLLPKKFPFLNNINVEIHYNPCDKVGGDFYNVFNLDENHIGFYIADVSGHGVSAAMVTFFVKELIDSVKKIIFPDGSYEFTTPSVIMEKVNLKILEEDFDGLYITMFYAILNVKTGEITWSNAGHLAYPIIYHNKSGEISILEMKTMALGWFDYARYSESTVKIDPKDKIVLYTDGITDSKNQQGKLFGVNGMSEIIKNKGKNSSASLAFGILKKLRKFQRNKELEDDVTLMLIEYLQK